MPAPFRYNLTGTKGDKTHCFRPKPLEGQDTSAVQHRALGQALAGQFNELCDNARASVIWEVT